MRSSMVLVLILMVGLVCSVHAIRLSHQGRIGSTNTPRGGENLLDHETFNAPSPPAGQTVQGNVMFDPFAVAGPRGGDAEHVTAEELTASPIPHGGIDVQGTLPNGLLTTPGIALYAAPAEGDSFLEVNHKQQEKQKQKQKQQYSMLGNVDSQVAMTPPTLPTHIIPGNIIMDPFADAAPLQPAQEISESIQPGTGNQIQDALNPQAHTQAPASALAVPAAPHWGQYGR